MENQPQSVNLSVSDLIMIQRIIQMAADRGAFRAEELSTVGQCYDRLVAWLEQTAPSGTTEDSTENHKGE